VYQTLEAGSPVSMVPAIRNILGGFLFSGDDVYKKAGVLSGGERTRLAVARMLLRPSNTLLLDEPTNHLDLDSKDVLLEALEDYGGTLIIVSHDRYFVEKLATKIIEIGHGEAVVYPGTYSEFLWSKAQADAKTQFQNSKSQNPAPRLQDPTAKSQVPRPRAQGATPEADTAGPTSPAPSVATGARAGGDNGPGTRSAPAPTRDERKRLDAERRKRQRAAESLQKRITDLESRIADRETQVKQLEASMSAPGFYDDREASRQALDRHQALMWEVGDLMAQWEALQEHASES
jgi:ATP-binding cassette subfamily F protein 3